MMKVFRPGLTWYANKIYKGECFSFVRYGDGEWSLTLGLWDHKEKSNRFPTAKNKLGNTILKPQGVEYYYAMQSLPFLSREKLLPLIEVWLKQYNACDIQWHCAEVFHRASRAKQLVPLIEQLWQRPVTVVGPEWLDKLPFTKSFIQVDSTNCWKDMNVIEKQLQIIPAGTVISFSTGPMTKILIHRLFPILGKTCWLIDFGSLWDPYCGVFSRGYHRHLRDVSPDTLRLK